jgi:glycosyltransferase involved in cell wall biosynthesis
MNNRIIIDVSHSFQTGLSTGIQRVVRETIRGLRQASLPYRLIWHPFGTNLGFYDVTEFYEITGADYVQRWYLKIGSSSIISRIKIVDNLYRYIRRSVKAKKFLDLWKLRRLRKMGIKSFNLEENDQLVLLDVFWNDPGILREIIKMKQSRNTLSLFIHDIFPITNPEWFEARSIKPFKENFMLAITSADNLITSSFSNREVILKNLHNLGRELPMVKVIPFGTSHLEFNVDIFNSSQPQGIVWVGTIEPRKNVDLLLDLVEKKKLDYPVLIIGKVGWKCEAEVSRLRKLTLQGRIDWKADADDKYLSEAISASQVGVITSLNEGFGFSIHEFMARNLNVVAPDIPIFQEVNYSQKRLYEQGNLNSLAHAIEDAIEDTKVQDADTKPKSWKVFANELSNFLS